MTIPVPLLDLKAQYTSIQKEIHEALDRVVSSQHFILGPEVEALEKEVASYSGCAGAVGVSSGTDAILVALMAAGVGHGDEVVTTPYTFLATATCIARLGARAVFVDVDPETYNIDAERVAAAIGPKTKAIVPVHLYGQMADTARIVAAAGKIPVIEDAAQAIGAEAHGKRAGSIGAMGCLSFFPSKNLGAFGDGGMVVGNDEALIERVRLLRNQGQSPKYFSIAVGGNFRLDALQAAVLRAKLPFLDSWTAARQKNADTYRQMFGGRGLRVTTGALDGDAELSIPRSLEEHRHIYNQFVIRVRRRDELRAFLAEKKIGSEVYYPQPMHMQRCFADWGYREGQFPVSEVAARESLAIPVHPELRLDQLETVVDAVFSFLRPQNLR